QPVILNTEAIQVWNEIFRRLDQDPKFRQLSPNTCRSYRSWIERLCKFSRNVSPGTLTSADIQAFFSSLTARGTLSWASLQQARSALRFLYREILKLELGAEAWEAPFSAAAETAVKSAARIARQNLPDQVDIATLLSGLEPPYDLIVKLISNCGLRLSECLELRLRDIDLEAYRLTLRRCRAQPERSLTFPSELQPELRRQIAVATHRHGQDLAAGSAGVFLPEGADAVPEAVGTDPAWQWLFPAVSLTRIRQT
ncbi:MAG: phage integrase N-terminal SAM-like domain-containing protein, partial [Candidatus Sericytochromatia bacterium]